MKESDKVIKPLSPREQEVVNLYTDPTNNTFLNKTQSIKQSRGYNASTDNSATVRGIEVLSRPRVAIAVKERLDAMGMGEDTRLQIVSNMAKGYIETIESETTDKDGKVTSTTTTKRPLSAKMQLEAIRHLNKVDGTDDMRQAEAHVMSDAMRALSRRLMRSKTIPPVHDTTHAQDAVVTRDKPLSTSTDNTVTATYTAPDANESHHV